MSNRIISALLLSFSCALAYAQAPADSPVELAANAPDKYVVKRGDSLWSISAKFLKSPWNWPDVWRMNREQIGSPHQLTPGQIILLDRGMASNGKPARPRLAIARDLRLGPKAYESKDDEAIPSIPSKDIEPFLSEPQVLAAGELDKAPKIITTAEDHVIIGQGDMAYVTGIQSDDKTWRVFRPAKPVLDPETKEVLGFEAFYLGTAKVKEASKMTGELTSMEILTAKREISRGDRLLPAVRPELYSYVPHAPEHMVKGRVAAIYDGVGETGRNYIVTLNRGKRDGLELGHVLGIYRAGRLLIQKNETSGEKEQFTIPEERFGLMFVFKVFDRISYALIMDSSRPVKIGDGFRNP